MAEHIDIAAGAAAVPGGARTLKHVNAMPAPTWSWLTMNETEIALAHPGASAAQRDAAVSVALEHGAATIERDAPGAFEQELKAIHARLDVPRVAPAENAGTAALDAPALSAYQSRAIAREKAPARDGALEGGMGDEAASYLRGIAGAPIVIEVPENRRAEVVIRVAGVDGVAAAVAIDVIARPGAALELTISLDSPAPGTGLVGASLRVLAERRSRVSVTGVQTLDDTWVALDDTGLLLDDDARVSVHHTVLGAGRSYTGLAGDLRGARASVSVDTDYLGALAQSRDFNYILRQHGKKTETALNANGVLTGESNKLLRGTIELVHGCKESRGSERETVLLADGRVRNKTIPVILCDEEDVAANHGATIGHIRDGQLLYLASRGLSPQAAEDLFVRAKLEDAALSHKDPAIRAAVCRLGRSLLDDFDEEIT